MLYLALKQLVLTNGLTTELEQKIRLLYKFRKITEEEFNDLLNN